VDITWGDGVLASATIRNISGIAKCTVRHGDKTVEIDFAGRDAVTLGANLTPE
jgi:hypothetical protein